MKGTPYDDEFTWWAGAEFTVKVINHADSGSSPINQPEHLNDLSSCLPFDWQAVLNPYTGNWEYTGATSQSGPGMLSRDRFTVVRGGSGWVDVTGDATVGWWDFGYNPPQHFTRNLHVHYRVYLRTERTQSATGLGGLTLAVTDMSDLTGWSGISAVPLQVSLAVPSGEQFDNVNVTAEVNTNADYLSQPYYDGTLPNDFSFAWTKLTGSPSWGWVGTANLGSITTSKEVNLLDDIGTVAANDTATIKVTVNYTYQGQPTSVELIQPVTMGGDNQ